MSTLLPFLPDQVAAVFTHVPPEHLPSALRANPPDIHLLALDDESAVELFALIGAVETWAKETEAEWSQAFQDNGDDPQVKALAVKLAAMKKSATRWKRTLHVFGVFAKRSIP